MKNSRSFLVAMVCTMFVIGIVRVTYNKKNIPKDSYTISSYVKICNNNGVVEDSNLVLEDCLNQDGDFELEITLGSKEKRKIGFEVSCIVNYEQVEFEIKAEERIQSYPFELEENEKCFKISIKKEYFKTYNNSFILNIRQDTLLHSIDSELVEKSNTINRRYLVKNSKKDSKKEEKVGLENTTRMFANVGNKDVCVLTSKNGKSGELIKVKKNNYLNMDVKISNGSLGKDYMIFAFLNSKQAVVNGKDYIRISVNGSEIGSQSLCIQIPNQVDLYDLEVYCVPMPYDYIIEKNFELYEILTTNRYTVKVE